MSKEIKKINGVIVRHSPFVPGLDICSSPTAPGAKYVPVPKTSTPGGGVHYSKPRFKCLQSPVMKSKFKAVSVDVNLKCFNIAYCNID